MPYDDLRAKFAAMEVRVGTLERESRTRRERDEQTSDRLRQTEILLTRLDSLVRAIEDVLRVVRNDVEGLKLSRARIAGLLAGSGAIGGMSGAVAQIAAAAFGG